MLPSFCFLSISKVVHRDREVVQCSWLSSGTFQYKINLNCTLTCVIILPQINDVETKAEIVVTFLISWADPWGWRARWRCPSAWRLPPVPVRLQPAAWSRLSPCCTAGWGTPRHLFRTSPSANRATPKCKCCAVAPSRERSATRGKQSSTWASVEMEWTLFLSVRTLLVMSAMDRPTDHDLWPRFFIISKALKAQWMQMRPFWRH